MDYKVYRLAVISIYNLIIFPAVAKYSGEYFFIMRKLRPFLGRLILLLPVTQGGFPFL